MASPFHLIVGGLRDLAGMELRGLELRPELPRAIPITQERDGAYFLVGLRFESADEAEKFAEGLSEFLVERDGERLMLKKPAPVKRDEQGNCFGIH